jgi:agmatine/peptidylarginine deiminase
MDRYLVIEERQVRYFLLFVVIVSCTAYSATSGFPQQPACPLTPALADDIRVAAEWEPVVGVLIGWPLRLPKHLIIEMAKGVDVYVTVCDSRHAQAAGRTLIELGIDPVRVHLVIAGQGSGYYVTRDWGPFAVFDGRPSYRLVDGRYLDYPLAGIKNRRLVWLTSLKRLDYGPDDAAPAALAQTLEHQRTELPLALTGGNVAFDGHGTGFASKILLAENRAAGISEEQFRGILSQELGVTRLHFLPNFERIGIQHIDCLFKLLDEERILVKRAPANHPAFKHIEQVVCHLAQLTNVYGRPYQILRIDTPTYHRNKMANYTNSLIVNRKIYVPLFGVPADLAALETWRNAMSGYEVIGFQHDDWSYRDALHCRVRGIWDPQMLYLRHKRMDACVSWAAKFTISVHIRDYSGAGLIEDKLQLAWRKRGSHAWKKVRLQPNVQEYAFQATIEGVEPGQTVEYYFSAAGRSGRQETLPRTAPESVFTCAIEGQREAN